MRLDVALVQRGLVESRERAQQLIAAGSVQVNERVVRKPSAKVADGDDIVLLSQLRYVSRGGEKLEAALKEFGVNVRGLTALDVGSATGGFTDCLLQHGAAKVYCVDVGCDQLAPRLRNDARVRVWEDTDIRALSSLPDLVDLAVVDVSFISLRLVLPAIRQFLKSDASRVIALLKPQFEAGPHQTTKRGVIKDPSVREKVVANFRAWAERSGWKVQGVIASPILGKEGNVEYLVDLRPTSIDITPGGCYIS
ncbi:MAG: TlyA family RNA methyltransferase [Abditibacteriales bacterium]|nr:TlyA family RNA methyltransferase [Abditibacteriales bacterium]